MKLSELEEVLQLYMGNPDAPAILLVGESGIGKSSFVEYIGQKYGYRVYIFRGAEHDATDLIGMPEIVKDKSGNLITKFIQPDWVPGDNEKFIFFADEINRARLDVRQACFRLVELRGTETWKINRKNHMVILAVNPDDGNYQVEQLDLAFINRPSIFYIEPDVDSFVAWGYTKGINKHILNFLQVNKSMLFVKPPADYGIKAYPTPRSWANASALLNKLEITSGQELPPKALSVLIANVGVEAASAFSNFLADPDQPVDAETVVMKGLSDEMKKKFEKHQDSQQTISKAIATLLNVVGVMKARKLSDANIKNISDLYKAIKSDDLKVMFIKSVPAEYYKSFISFIPIEELEKLSEETVNKLKNLKK